LSPYLVIARSAAAKQSSASSLLCHQQHEGPASANARFTLHSELRDESTVRACGAGVDAILANGFQ